MLFKIAHHSGTRPPADALDRLLAKLGPERENVRFTKAGSELRADWRGGASAMSHEQSEMGRRAVFEMVRDICERSPGLDVEWFAVSKLPEPRLRRRR